MWSELKQGVLFWLGMGLTLGAFAHEGHLGHAPGIPQHCATPSPLCAATVSVAVDRQGLLWRAFVNGQTLYLQQRNAEGEFAAPLRVNTQPEPIANKGEDRPQLAFGPRGEIYLVWTQPLPANFSGNVRFIRSLDGGKHFSEPVTINQDRHITAHRFPVMKTNVEGAIFMAWIDKRDQFDPKDDSKISDKAAIYFTRSVDRGKSFLKQDLRIASSSCECCRIGLDFDANALPVFFFRNVFDGSERDHAEVTFTEATTPGPVERITFNHWQLDGCPHQGPSLLMNGQRRHYFWFDRKQLYYRYAEGKQLSEPSAVGTLGSEHGSLAQAGGVLYRAWQVFADGAMRVLFQRSADQGEHWSKPLEVANTQGASDYPQLVSDGRQVWLSWLTRKAGHQLVVLPREEQP